MTGSQAPQARSGGAHLAALWAIVLVLASALGFFFGCYPQDDADARREREVAERLEEVNAQLASTSTMTSPTPGPGSATRASGAGTTRPASTTASSAPIPTTASTAPPPCQDSFGGAYSIIEDDTFPEAQWTAEILVASAEPSEFTVSLDPTGGPTGGPARIVSHRYGVGTIIVAHRSSTWLCARPVRTIQADLDLRHIGSDGHLAVAYSLLVTQNGSTYTSAPVSVFNDTWEAFSFGELTAADFVLVAGSGPATPDLATGGPWQLGYASANSAPEGNAVAEKSSAIGRFSVAVTFES